MDGRRFWLRSLTGIFVLTILPHSKWAIDFQWQPVKFFQWKFQPDQSNSMQRTVCWLDFSFLSYHRVRISYIIKRDLSVLNSFESHHWRFLVRLKLKLILRIMANFNDKNWTFMRMILCTRLLNRQIIFSSYLGMLTEDSRSLALTTKKFWTCRFKTCPFKGINICK